LKNEPIFVLIVKRECRHYRSYETTLDFKERISQEEMYRNHSCLV